MRFFRIKGWGRRCLQSSIDGFEPESMKRFEGGYRDRELSVFQVTERIGD